MSRTCRLFLLMAFLTVALREPVRRVQSEEPRAPLVLREAGAGSGLSFRYESGTRGRHDLPEIMGGGVALIDADADGRLDVYLTNGGPLGPQPGAPDPPCRLYRNLGGGRFAEQSDSGAPGPSYAMGAAVADYDGDGLPDLFVTGWRDQRLYRNRGQGRFEDRTEQAGLTSSRWSTSAAWADLDADGDLDLFVANYLTYDPPTAPYCAAPDGRRDYCGPEEFPAEPDALYRNNGDGTFTDVSAASGIVDPDGRGLGVVVADLVGDARPDLFVANDGTACRLYENLGGLRFRDVATRSGVALDGQGDPLAGMGTAIGDIDGDLRSDLVVGNLLGRTTTAFLRIPEAGFVDGSRRLGLNQATRHVTGFGLALVDLDADGRLDLIQANGHVVDRARLGTPFAMRPSLLTLHEGRFVDATDPGWGWPLVPRLGRGLAVGDLDGDLRPDVVVANLDGPPTLLLNASRNRPAVLELVGASARARVPFGARVRATYLGRTIVRDLPGGGSYLAASEPRIVLGPATDRPIDRIEVRWPSGRVESWTRVPPGPLIRLVEGSGREDRAP